jgi:hypothetical protein
MQEHIFEVVKFLIILYKVIRFFYEFLLLFRPEIENFENKILTFDLNLEQLVRNFILQNPNPKCTKQHD